MKYKIIQGYDHYNGIPLYQVCGVDNEYLGDWHIEAKEAIRELKSLQS